MKPTVGVVFIGHVDAGKSTLCGQLLYLSGQIDERLLAKCKQLAIENNRESWWLAYLLDTSDEERARGKTINLGRAQFETESRQYTILDAPGHKQYVPNMINGVTQADIAVLVVSARSGEFEAGFEKSGQTREHLLLAKTLGVRYMIIAVNKMDDQTVLWSEKRYLEILSKLEAYCKTIGYKNNRDLFFLPISGYLGQNIFTNHQSEWYSEKSLVQTLDGLDITRGVSQPLIIVQEVTKESGKTCLLGRVEGQDVAVNQVLVASPGNKSVQITGILNDTDESLETAAIGSIITFIIKCDEEIHTGNVLSIVPIPNQTRFVAQVKLFTLSDSRPIFTIDSTAMMHIHTESVMVKCLGIVSETIDGVNTKTKFIKSGALATIVFETSKSICMNEFSVMPQLGRFTLRDSDTTIGIGKIISLGKNSVNKTN